MLFEEHYRYCFLSWMFLKFHFKAIKRGGRKVSLRRRISMHSIRRMTCFKKYRKDHKSRKKPPTRRKKWITFQLIERILTMSIIISRITQGINLRYNNIWIFSSKSTINRYKEMIIRRNKVNKFNNNNVDKIIKNKQLSFLRIIPKNLIVDSKYWTFRIKRLRLKNWNLEKHNKSNLTSLEK